VSACTETTASNTRDEGIPRWERNEVCQDVPDAVGRGLDIDRSTTFSQVVPFLGGKSVDADPPHGTYSIRPIDESHVSCPAHSGECPGHTGWAASTQRL